MRNRLNLCVIASLWLTLAGFTTGHAQTPTASATPQVARSVRGGGTTGQLSKWISFDTISDSIVTESNGNIGIGTTTPGSKLTVAGRIEGFTTGTISAVLGQSPNGSGVRGNSDTGLGVFGSSTSGNGTQGLSDSGNGVFGHSLTGNGVRGDTSNGSTAGVLGFNNASGGNGVLGQAFNGTGVRGISSTSFGVFGSSDSFTAVEARSTTGFGVFGSSNTNTGIHGQSNAGFGIFGSSNSNTGIHGQSNTGVGVFGFTNQGTAIFGHSPNGTALFGLSDNNLGAGVSGFNSTAGIGVTGQTGTGLGVFGASNTGIGVLAQSNDGPALMSLTGGGPAGEFIGDVSVSGTLTKGGGSFKIDHPLDPANKTLSHSFVESPDMMNIYNGNIITDEVGEATVTLPEYFEALNRDFRYQLTVIGQFAQAIVAEEVKHNRFRITTNIPAVKVSWQVTGIRRDVWAERHRIPVEKEKPESERGFYLHPELFGQEEDRRVEWARHPELMDRARTIKQKQSQ
jgi:hypothetical protein